LINKSHHPGAPTIPAKHQEKEVSIVIIDYKTRPPPPHL